MLKLASWSSKVNYVCTPFFFSPSPSVAKALYLSENLCKCHKFILPFEYSGSLTKIMKLILSNLSI